MKIKFKGINNPREGYGFGPVRCHKCESNSTAFLEIKTWQGYIVLCKKCLNEGEDIINKTILSDCKR